MTNNKSRRAIVIGGSMAGLLAARVLSDIFDEVVVYERNHYPTTPAPRSGVPQAAHAHVLLMRGMQILDELFPHLAEELLEAGAHKVDTAAELCLLSFHGWRRPYESGQHMLTFTRPFLDWHIRQRLKRRPNVIVAAGARVNGLTTEPAGTRVTGVRVAYKNGIGEVETREAELVVAATGRTGKVAEWLVELGYAHPKTEEVDPHLGYASALFRPSPMFGDDWKWKVLLLLGRPPDATRVGTLLPVEDNRWLVTLVGIGGDYPPTNYEAFLEFAASLRSPLLFRALEEAEPISSIRGNRSTKNILHHYHTLPRWPEGLVVTGDALCSLNPIYGQGMTVSALQALELGKCLRGHLRLSHLARACQRRLYLVTKTPWLLATGEDLSWPTTTGKKVSLFTKMMHFYVDQVASLAITSRTVDHAFLEVSHLLKSPLVLFRPDIFGRVVLKLLRPDHPTADSPLPGVEWMAT